MGTANGKPVGIIGAGRIGQAMARTALRARRPVVLANSRGPESLTSVVSALGEGVSAGTVQQAAGAGIVVVAVPWPRVQQALEGLEWGGQVVIDATNDFEPGDLNGRTSSEVVADLVGGARVVKAANTLAAAVLGSDPHEAGGQRVVFLSGDDTDAKAEVISLFGDAGFSTIDLGTLVRAAPCSSSAPHFRGEPDPAVVSKLAMSRRAPPAATSDEGVVRTPESARGLLDREDLLQVLDRAVTKRVTVISAPPGSGKTSLLRAWSDRSTQLRRVVFVSVRATSRMRSSSGSPCWTRSASPAR